MIDQILGWINRIVSASVLGSVLSIALFAQQPQSTNSISIKGIAISEAGPIQHRVVILFPIDPKSGMPVTIFASGSATLSLDSQRKSVNDPWEYFYSIVGSGAIFNPRATTNEKGEFSIVIPRAAPASSSDSPKSGVFGLGIFEGTAKKPAISRFEIELIKIEGDPGEVDTGKLLFNPVKVPALKT